MLDRFDTFGDHLAVEGFGQADDAFDNGEVLRVVKHIADKGLVDFQGVGRQAAEVGE